MSQRWGAWGVAVRPRAFAVVALLALSLALVAVAAVERYGAVERIALPVPALQSGLGEPVRAEFAAGRAAGSPRRAACACRRADSLLWGDGVARLSILIAPRGGEPIPLWVTPGETVQVLAPEARAREIAFDLAVVNNSAIGFETLSLVVTFAHRTAAGRRTGMVERGLFWPADLGPGESVRWSVEAEGTELKVDCAAAADLGDIALAPPEAFHRLLRAHLPAVRVHAAMMLAYLGEPRARELTLALGPLGKREERARGEILRALEPLRACQRRPSRGALELCVHNATDRLVRRVELREHGEHPEARSWRVDDLFLAGRGLKLRLPLAGRQPPERLAIAAVEPERRSAGE